MRSLSLADGTTNRSRSGASTSSASSRSARARSVVAPAPPSTSADPTIRTMSPIRSTAAGQPGPRSVSTLCCPIWGRAPERSSARKKGDAFVARIEQVWLDLYEALEMLYGSPTPSNATGTDLPQLATDALTLALRSARERRPDLRALDRRREIDALVPAGPDDRLCRVRRPVCEDVGGCPRSARLPRRAGRDVPAPDAAARASQRRERRRLCRRRLPFGRPETRDDGRPGSTHCRPARAG